MKVIFFHRKPRPFNFSVESLFKQIRNAFTSDVECEVKELKFYSEGVFKRLYIGFEAALNQGEINHVTGDVNFIGIFLRGGRTVLTILDVGFMNHPNPSARLILKWFWIVLPVRNCRIITTISHSAKMELLKYVQVDPDKIRVVYVPISSIFVRCPRDFNKDKPEILQIGTKPNKNVIRLVEALGGIRCKLTIIGEVSGELLDALQKFKIEWQSFKNLSDQDVLERYNQADIVAFVSTYEGFGMPIVEANSVGRVVVTSEILSMPEIGSNAAHYVNPFDIDSIRHGILKVIDDDEYRAKLIRNGYENCKRFDAKQIASEFTSIYREIIR